MAIILIKDLPESLNLDREAMVAITGGTRSGGASSHFRSGTFSGISVIKHSAGSAGGAPVGARVLPAKTLLNK